VVGFGAGTGRLWDRRGLVGLLQPRWPLRGTSPPASLDDRCDGLLAEGASASIQAMAAPLARSAAEQDSFRAGPSRAGFVDCLKVVRQVHPTGADRHLHGGRSPSNQVVVEAMAARWSGAIILPL